MAHSIHFGSQHTFWLTVHQKHVVLIPVVWLMQLQLSDLHEKLATLITYTIDDLNTTWEEA